MPLYTLVLEFGGGTFVTQVRASGAKNAVKKYATELLKNESVAESYTRKLLAHDLAKDDPTRVDTVNNVWCCTASAKGKFALLNVIRTAE